jgi:hypothetical protein
MIFLKIAWLCLDNARVVEKERAPEALWLETNLPSS